MAQTAANSNELILLAGVVAAGWLVLFSKPVRSSIRDGLRCIRRHPSMWTILAWLGAGYAVFKLAIEFLFYFLLPGPDKPVFMWHRAFLLSHTDRVAIGRESILPSVEKVAGIFNNVVTTYPLSALGALLLICNWDNHHVTFARALKRRFGRWGFLLHAAVLLCAAAAIAKPCLYAGLPFLGRTGHAEFWLQVSGLVDWLSFLFEYLLGVCVQIYLILLAYVWVRGMGYTSRHLWDVSIRRMGAVARWAGVVIAASTLLLSAPLIIADSPRGSQWLPLPDVMIYIDTVARPVLAAFLLLFSTMQITLTFHSESLGRALHGHWAFVRKHWGNLACFILFAAIQFYLFNVVNRAIIVGKGEGTAVVVAWRLFSPLLDAVLAGWMLASWVCLFKRLEQGRGHESLVGF